MPLNFDKLDDYFLWFDALVPGGLGVGTILLGKVPLGIAILVACALIPAVDHMRANVSVNPNLPDNSGTKRIRSWLFMIVSTAIMALLVSANTSFDDPLSWIGMGGLFFLVWAIVVQFRKAAGADLDPYDRMFLASGEVLGLFTAVIAYLGAAIIQAASLLRVGSPAIPAFFLVLVWAEILLTTLAVKGEIISQKLLTYDAPGVGRPRGNAGRFFRRFEEVFPFLSLAMAGMTVESGLRTPRVLATFALAIAAFLLLAVTIPAVSFLGWNTITIQMVGANLALGMSLAFYARLTTAEVMRAGRLPRF